MNIKMAILCGLVISNAMHAMKEEDVQEKKDIQEKQKEKEKLIEKYGENAEVEFSFTEASSKILLYKVVKSPTLLNLLLDIAGKNTLSLSVPIVKYSKRIFDACFSDNMITDIQQFDNEEMNQFLDCYYRYLDMPIDASLARALIDKKMQDLAFKCTLQGFFLPLAIKKSVLDFPKKSGCVYYDAFNKQFFVIAIDDREEHCYYLVKDTTFSFGDKISSKLYEKNYFYRDNKSYKDRQSYNIIARMFKNEDSLALFRCKYTFCNWLHSSSYNYDLSIESYSNFQISFDELNKRTSSGAKQLIHDCVKSKNIYITIDRHSLFLNDMILSKNKLKIPGIDQGYWCQSFATDGINLFILLRSEAKGSTKLLHYAFNFDQLQKTLKNEKIFEENSLIANAITIVKTIDIMGLDISNATVLEMCPLSKSIIIGYNNGTIKFFDFDKSKIHSCDIVNVGGAITSISLDKDEKTLAINTPEKCFFYDMAIIKGPLEEDRIHDLQENQQKAYQAFQELTEWEDVEKKEEKPLEFEYTLQKEHQQIYDIVTLDSYVYDKNIKEDGFLVRDANKPKNLKILSKANQQWDESGPLGTQDRGDEYGGKCYKRFDKGHNVETVCKISKNAEFAINFDKGSIMKTLGFYRLSPQKYLHFREYCAYYFNVNTVPKSNIKNDFIKSATEKGICIINVCNDKDDIFMVTDGNEILHYGIEFKKARFFFQSDNWSLNFKKKYDIDTQYSITGIAYSKKRQCIALGFENGELQILDVSSGSIKPVEMKNFAEPIEEVIFNNSEENILLASKSKYVIYKFTGKNDHTVFLKENIVSQDVKKDKTSFFWQKVALAGALAAGAYAFYKKYFAPSKK